MDTEPVRKSVYDMIIRTLKIAGRVTYLHRIIYIGEHSFSEKTKTTIHGTMEKIVNDINNDFCYEKLTGLLLYYPNYFVHLIDGAEDSLMKHLTILLQDYKDYLGRMKILVSYNHINQKFFDTWGARTAEPPTLLERINPASDFEETFRYIDICLQKMYNLGIQLRVPVPEKDVNFIGTINDRMTENLPEYSLLDFLLNSQYIKNAEEYVSHYLQIPDMIYMDGVVWPVRMDFVPRDVFDQDQELIPELPRN